jgi:hypothetical protein
MALEDAYRRARQLARIQDAIDKAVAGMEDEAAPATPDGLAERLAEAVKGKALSWDRALWEIVRGR